MAFKLPWFQASDDIEQTLSGLTLTTQRKKFPVANSPYYILPSALPTALAAAGVAANQVRAFKFWLPFKLEVAHVSFRVSAASAGNFASVGVYTANGNTLLIDSAPISTAATGVKTAVLATPYVLAPDVYYLAWTLSSGAPDISAVNPAANVDLVLNDVDVNLGLAANASVAGQLPATLGAIAGGNYNVALVKLGS